MTRDDVGNDDDYDDDGELNLYLAHFLPVFGNFLRSCINFNVLNNTKPLGPRPNL